MQGLEEFHAEASSQAYAGGGEPVKPQRLGFEEYEHKNGKWLYRDSFAGFLRSYGQEVIWYYGNPLWICLYGGGMEPKFMDQSLAIRSFDFLKKALLNVKGFSPRGPAEFVDGDWKYICNWSGSIEDFKGDEEILFNDEVVFKHHFFGGLMKS